MSNTEGRGMKVSLYRAIIIGAVALALIAVSFHGGLDGFAQEEVADTTNESIGIYVVARAINALVSVLQTSQVNVPLLASVQVGQMLDPVNDAVERLSSIVVWAVGSLFVQQIVLEVAASPVFKWILCSIGVAMTALLLLLEWSPFRVGCGQILAVSDSKLERCRDWLVRLFVVAAIFRFIVPAFIALSFLVSQMFLESEIAKNTEQLSVLRTQVSSIASSPSPEGETLEQKKTDEEMRMQGLEESKASARQELERLDTRLGKLNDEAGLPQRFLGSLGLGSPGEDLQEVKQRRQEVDWELERIDDAILESEEALECIDTRIAGGSCDSLWDRVSKAGTAGISQLKETFGKLNDMVTEITMLLVAIAIKNILFPILFLTGAVKCSLPIARHASRLLCGFEEDARKLKETIASQTERPERRLEQPKP